MFATILAAAVFLAASVGPAQPSVTLAPAFSTPAASATARVVSLASNLSSSAQLPSEEREFIDRINAARTERGLYALATDSVLTQVAYAHSRDMALHGYFSHIAPLSGQRTPMDRYVSALRALGRGAPSYLLVGENIYYCSMSRGSADVSLAHQDLMNSPGHRANILDSRFDRVGVGVYRDGSGRIWVTEVFARSN